MIELSLAVIEAQQQGADHAAAAGIAEAADDAIGRPQALHLDHGALSRLVDALEPLGDDTVGRPFADAVQPALGALAVAGIGRELEPADPRDRLAKGVQRGAPAQQRLAYQGAAIRPQK